MRKGLLTNLLVLFYPLFEWFLSFNYLKYHTIDYFGIILRGKCWWFEDLGWEGSWPSAIHFLHLPRWSLFFFCVFQFLWRGVCIPALSAVGLLCILLFVCSLWFFSLFGMRFQRWGLWICFDGSWVTWYFPWGSPGGSDSPAHFMNLQRSSTLRKVPKVDDILLWLSCNWADWYEILSRAIYVPVQIPPFSFFPESSCCTRPATSSSSQFIQENHFRETKDQR